MASSLMKIAMTTTLLYIQVQQRFVMVSIITAMVRSMRVLEISYEDADGDGYGNEEISHESCEIPEGYVPFSTNCDDTNPSVYPSAEEICDA